MGSAAPHHHRTSNTLEDLHSPVVHSLRQSHIGWVFSPEFDGTDEQTVKDLIRYPELRWLDHYYWLPPLALAGLCFPQEAYEKPEAPSKAWRHCDVSFSSYHHRGQ